MLIAPAELLLTETEGAVVPGAGREQLKAVMVIKSAPR